MINETNQTEIQIALRRSEFELSNESQAAHQEPPSAPNRLVRSLPVLDEVFPSKFALNQSFLSNNQKTNEHLERAVDWLD